MPKRRTKSQQSTEVDAIGNEAGTNRYANSLSEESSHVVAGLTPKGKHEPGHKMTNERVTCWMPKLMYNLLRRNLF
jgi:hypothetical protein